MLFPRLLFAVLAITVAHAQSVYLFSLDGLGHQLFTHTRELKTLHRLAKRGAQAAGIQPAFPSTTSNSHAALFTGTYGDVSNQTANSQPKLPRADHAFLERVSGYRADQLAAEPLWVTAARQGIPTIAYQVPQAIPLRPINNHQNALTINGYQSRQIGNHGIYHRRNLTFDSPTTFHLQHGPVILKGSITKTGLVLNGIDVPFVKAETGLKSNRPLARHFSHGLYLPEPVPAIIYFRLFEYTASDLLLYISPIQESAFSHGSAEAFIRQAGGFIGNTYQGPALSHEQSLEVMELLVRQNFRHTQWLVQQRHPGLFLGYLPTADELGHRYLGLALRNDPAAKRYLHWGFQIIERWSQEIAKLLTRQDHLIITADHGMAPTYKLVNVNEILRRAGLGSQALHVYNSILINDTSWKNGTVTDRVAVRNQVQAALEKYPQIFTAFFTPEKDGAKFGIGGPAGFDLYFDLAVGYTVRDQGNELFPKLDQPAGNHGFRPDRDDMLATLFALGPKIKRGTQWPRRKSIDVAPLTTALLGIQPPMHSRGLNPLQEK